jgi:predicted nuclease of predicted toxin-antitoxin system
MGGKERRSKKRSAASSKSTQLEPLVFFLDRSLGKEIIAGALRTAGADVRVHDDLFAQDARDLDWLPEVGKKGWTVLTKDSHIKHRLVEPTALLESGVRAFVLVSGNVTGPEMATIFVKALPRMTRFAAKHAPPFIAKVHRDGSIEIWIG